MRTFLMTMQSEFGATCPSCRRSAPIVYRGVLAYCTACGAPRMPLVAKSTNLAGKPSIIGGALTRVFGWIVLTGGTAFGLAMLGLLQAIFPAGFAGWAVGLPIILISLTVGVLLLRGGKSLESTGVAEQRDTHTAAIFSLAEHNQNTVTAPQVAGALGVSTQFADELLTSLAKSHPEHVVLEVDDQGNVFYRVSARGLSRIASFDAKLAERSGASRGAGELEGQSPSNVKARVAQESNVVESPGAEEPQAGVLRRST